MFYKAWLKLKKKIKKKIHSENSIVQTPVYNI